MAVAGLSTIGVQLGYAVETTAGTRPTTGYKELTRINSIGGVTVDLEQIDASALIDKTTKNIAGRGSVGDWSVTVNVTNDTIAEWQGVKDAADEGKTADKGLWFEIIHPQITDGYFVKAELPDVLPWSDTSQNELLTMEISLTVAEVLGYATKVSFQ